MRRNVRARLCALMSAVFLLMSGCLIVQALVYEAPAYSCHGEPASDGKDQPLKMEQCCKQALLKAQHRIVPDFHHAGVILPAPPTSGPQLSCVIGEARFAPLTPPTAVRLAELSLLRI